MKTRHITFPHFKTGPSPPQMFAPKLVINNGTNENSRRSPRSKFRRPPTSQPLHLSSTQGRQARGNNAFTPEPVEVGPSAITASFRRPSFISRFAELEPTGSSPRLELEATSTDGADRAQATAERVRQARERAAVCRILQAESRNLNAALSNMPTPPSSQPSVFQDQPSLTATLEIRRGASSSSATSSSFSSSPRDTTAGPSDFISRFLASCLPPLTHLRPALVHARLTEARIRGMGVRWAAADIEEFLLRKLGQLRDANDALVDDVDLTFLARHCVYYFGVGSGSRGDEI